MDVTTIGSNALLFENLPPANQVSLGRVYRASNVGPAPGIRLESDGTRWRPRGGSQVLVRRFVPITLQNTAQTLIETFGPFPGGLVKSNMGLRIDSLWGLDGFSSSTRFGWITVTNAATSSVSSSANAITVTQSASSQRGSARAVSAFNALNDTSGPHTAGLTYSTFIGYSNQSDVIGALTVNLSQPWYINLIGRSVAETAVNLSGATWAGGVATFTATAHTLAVGDKTVISGVTPAGYNGTFIVASVPNANTFTVALATDPGTYTLDGSSSRISNVISRNIVIELLG